MKSGLPTLNQIVRTIVAIATVSATEQKYFSPGRAAQKAARLKHRSHLATTHQWCSKLHLRTWCRHLVLFQQIYKKQNFHFSGSLCQSTRECILAFIVFHLFAFPDIAGCSFLCFQMIFTTSFSLATGLSLLILGSKNKRCSEPA